MVVQEAGDAMGCSVQRWRTKCPNHLWSERQARADAGMDEPPTYRQGDGKAEGMTFGSEYLAQVGDCMEARTARLRDAFEHSNINNRKTKNKSFSNTTADISVCQTTNYSWLCRVTGRDLWYHLDQIGEIYNWLLSKNQANCSQIKSEYVWIRRKTMKNHSWVKGAANK